MNWVLLLCSLPLPANHAIEIASHQKSRLWNANIPALVEELYSPGPGAPNSPESAVAAVAEAFATQRSRWVSGMLLGKREDAVFE